MMLRSAFLGTLRAMLGAIGSGPTLTALQVVSVTATGMTVAPVVSVTLTVSSVESV